MLWELYCSLLYTYDYDDDDDDDDDDYLHHHHHYYNFIPYREKVRERPRQAEAGYS